MTTAPTITELAAIFQNKVQLIRQKMDLREIDMSKPPSVLASVEQSVNELRVLLTVMRAENNRRKSALQMMQAYKDEVKGLQTRIKHASSNLPPHLPNRLMPPPPVPVQPVSTRDTSRIPLSCTPKPQSRFSIPETPATASADTPSIEQIKRKSQMLFVPALDYVTMEEFGAVPKYMKGRITYSQVNAAVDEFNKALDVKYSALAVPKMKRSEKCKTACRKYKEQENADTKGIHFVVEADLKEHTKLSRGKESLVLLTILRHCGRIREIRSKGLIRYALSPSTSQH